MSPFRVLQGYYLALFLSATGLHVLLAFLAPDPNGYVYDFYSDAIVLTYENGRLPAATDCWVCYHPPLLSLVGTLVFHVVDWFGGSRPTQLFAVASLLNALSLLFAIYTFAIYRHYRKNPQMDLVLWALLLFLPVSFISAFSIEADILSSTLIVISTYYLLQLLKTHSLKPLYLTAVFVALAALAKYTGLIIAIYFGAILLIRFYSNLTSEEPGSDLASPPGFDRFLLRQGIIYAIVVCLLGGYPYLDKHGTPTVGNKAWNTGKNYFHLYDFSSFRLPGIVDVFTHPANAYLNHYPAFNSEVLTSHYGQLWTDFSVYTRNGRHGQRPRGLVYKDKYMPDWLLWAILVCGLIPVGASLVGAAILVWQRQALLLLIMSAISITLYVKWFLGSDTWMLKTKYFLYLLPLWFVAIERSGHWIPYRILRIGLVPAVLMSFAYCFFFAVY